MAAAYHLLVFTDFVEDSKGSVKYGAGWSIIAVTIFNIAVNVIVMLQGSYYEAKSAFITLKNKCLNKKV